MLPAGFLGTEADILMDLVVVSLVAILPLLLWSVILVRRKRWPVHQRLMTILASVLGVVVLLFELDIRLAGGFDALSVNSRYHQTAILDASLIFHLIIAVSTSLIWGWLILSSRKRFGQPPQPGEFSVTHRRWGWRGLVGMVLTGITGLQLYIMSFVL